MTLVPPNIASGLTAPEAERLKPSPEGEFSKLTPGQIVLYQDPLGVVHPAMVTKIHDAQGVITLVEFGVVNGDEPARLQPAVRYSKSPVSSTWRYVKDDREK